MNRRQLLTTLGLGVATLTAATATTLARRQQPPRLSRIVTTKTDAYLIGKIEPLLNGKVEEVVPAPKGRYVLIQQALRPEPPERFQPTYGEEKLWLYDALRRTTKLIYRVQDDATAQTMHGVSQLTWFPSTARALVLHGSIRRLPATPDKEIEPEIRVEPGIFDAERGTIRWLSGVPKELEGAQTITGLDGLLLEGRTESPKQRLLSVLRPDGSLSTIVKVPYERYTPMVRGISPDGKRLFLGSPFLKNAQWSVADLSTGVVTELKEAPKKDAMVPNSLEDEAPHGALKLYGGSAQLTDGPGRTARTNALWLEANEPGPEKKFVRGLVTAEAERSYLLPDLSTVLFTHDDSLYAAPIASLDRVAFEKLMRELAMSNAKQVGLGLMMYAQDYDENLPHDPSGIKESVLPYLKNSDLLAEFVYTYKGSTGIGSIKEPATTPLGYLPGPGGRAVVYGDGHVKWESP